MAAFEEHQQLERFPNGRLAEAALVERWSEHRGKETPLVLGTTRAEVSRLNAEIQRRREAGSGLGDLVSEEPRLRVGDRVVFRRNNAFLGVRNGDVGVVKGRRASQNDQRIVVRVGDRVVAAAAGEVWLGYAVTTHKAQGATVEEAMALAARTDARMLYVQASRARGRVDLLANVSPAGLGS